MTRWVATVNGRATTVDVEARDGRYRITIGDQVLEIDTRRVGHGLYSLLIDGAVHVADVARAGREALRVEVAGGSYVIEIEEHARHVIRTRGGAGGRDGHQTIRTPLPGKVTHVAVAAGDSVEAGDTVVVIEAMKMQNEFKAAAAGVVAEVRVQPGQAVNAGDVLIVIGG